MDLTAASRCPTEALWRETLVNKPRMHESHLKRLTERLSLRFWNSLLAIMALTLVAANGRSADLTVIRVDVDQAKVTELEDATCQGGWAGLGTGWNNAVFDNFAVRPAKVEEQAGKPAVEPWLRERLEWFQDQKFGFMMHFGVYSQWGCIESWPLVEEDKWARPDDLKAWTDRDKDLARFQRDYWALSKTFNPEKFDPRLWARAAKAAGMKYVVFTTKHHDGFSLFDTRLSDYRITSAEVPFHSNARSNVVREVFNAFRREKFGIGAYFSKADWHCPDYWDPTTPARTRNPNYSTALQPDKWKKFVQYTHGQIEELMTDYGPIDILWLDAGQVRPPEQDIQMDRLAAMARAHQPRLIIVDRTVGGRYENYRTPEQEVPDKPLPYVWESCLTMGDQWSFEQSGFASAPATNSVFLQTAAVSPMDLTPTDMQTADMVLFSRFGDEAVSLGIAATASMGEPVVQVYGQVLGSVGADLSSLYMLLQTRPGGGLLGPNGLPPKFPKGGGGGGGTSAAACAWIPLAVPSNAVSMSFDFMLQGDGQDDSFAVAVNGTNVLSLAMSLIQTNVTLSSGLIGVSPWAGQTVELFLGIVGGTSTNASLTAGAITFYGVVPPSLQVQASGSNLVVTWPVSADGYALETSTSLTGTNSWALVTNVPAIVYSQYTVTNALSAGSRFYRLKRTP